MYAHNLNGLSCMGNQWLIFKNGCIPLMSHSRMG